MIGDSNNYEETPSFEELARDVSKKGGAIKLECTYYEALNWYRFKRESAGRNRWIIHNRNKK